jgi:hypothetical protein
MVLLTHDLHRILCIGWQPDWRYDHLSNDSLFNNFMTRQRRCCLGMPNRHHQRFNLVGQPSAGCLQRPRRHNSTRRIQSTPSFVDSSSLSFSCNSKRTASARGPSSTRAFSSLEGQSRNPPAVLSVMACLMVVTIRKRKAEHGQPEARQKQQKRCGMVRVRAKKFDR